jgi:hypothetical protein
MANFEIKLGGGGGNGIIIPPGSYEVELQSIEPIEVVNTNPDWGEVGKKRTRLLWKFVEPKTQGECPYWTSESYTMAPNCKLRLFLEQLNEGLPLPKEATKTVADITQYCASLIGGKWRVVIQTQTSKAGKEFNMITFFRAVSFLPSSPTATSANGPLKVEAADDVLPF